MKVITALVTALALFLTMAMALPASKHPLDTYPESESPQYYDLVSRNNTSPASPLSYTVTFNCRAAGIAFGWDWKIKICGYDYPTRSLVLPIWLTPLECQVLCHCSCSTDLTYAYCSAFGDLCSGAMVKQICTATWNADGPGPRGGRCRCVKQGGGSAGEAKREIDGPTGNETTCG